MSFWPFGQSFNSSNINGILDDYFHVLHELENQAQIQAAQTGLDTNGTSSVGVSTGEWENNPVHEDSIEESDSIDPVGGMEENGSSKPSLIPTSRRGYNRGVTRSSLSPAKSGLSQFASSSSESTSPSPEITTGEPTSRKALSHKFMDEILEETELLNELTRQNNTLLDFVCFGYFYTESGEKVENIQFLIDQLMICIDRINEDDQEPDDQKTDDEDEKEDNGDNVNDKNNDEGSMLQPSNDNEHKNSKFDNDENGNSEDLMALDAEDESIIPSIHNPEHKKRSTFLNKANIISEIFALDIWLISESLVKNPDYLEKIWSIMQHPKFTEEKSPLIPIFLKINQNLLVNRQDQYLNFIRSRTNLVKNMLAHIHITLLMDFFLKIIATDKQEAPTGVIELVSDQNIIAELFSFLDNDKYTADIQTCAGDFIKSIIAISANAPLDEMSIGPNSLTREIASESCIDYLIDCILEKRGSALMTAVSITIELIRKNNSDYDQVNLLTTTIKTHPPSMRDPVYLGVMLRKFSVGLVDLKGILIDVAVDKNIPLVENQLGEKYKPLGFERFKVVELIAELLHCSNMALMNSKKAERIVKERDQVRQELIQQLEDALTDLEIDKKVSDSYSHFTSNDEGALIGDDIDESFDVPYVNDNQNAKLRSNPTVGDHFKIALYDAQLLPMIFNLFIEYPWNNFWHNVVFDIIQQIFNGRMDFSYNSFLVFALFSNKNAGKFATNGGVEGSPIDFQITKELVLRGYKNSHKFFEKYNTSLGYMGHLVLIAEEIVKFSKVYKVELISPDIHEVLSEDDWVFYSNDILNDTRIMYSKILGGGDYVDDGTLKSEMITGNDQDPSTFSTQMDLHKKLREKLVEQSRDEIDHRNKENGVIILPSP